MKSSTANQALDSPQLDALDLPLDREILFSDHKGNYKKRIENRQTKLLKKAPFLKSFLREDEKIETFASKVEEYFEKEERKRSLSFSFPTIFNCIIKR